MSDAPAQSEVEVVAVAAVEGQGSSGEVKMKLPAVEAVPALSCRTAGATSRGARRVVPAGAAATAGERSVLVEDVSRILDAPCGLLDAGCGLLEIAEFFLCLSS
jgi:hypothetical protein